MVKVDVVLRNRLLENASMMQMLHQDPGSGMVDVPYFPRLSLFRHPSDVVRQWKEGGDDRGFCRTSSLMMGGRKQGNQCYFCQPLNHWHCLTFLAPASRLCGWRLSPLAVGHSVRILLCAPEPQHGGVGGVGELRIPIDNSSTTTTRCDRSLPTIHLG